MQRLLQRTKQEVSLNAVNENDFYHLLLRHMRDHISISLIIQRHLKIIGIAQTPICGVMWLRILNILCK